MEPNEDLCALKASLTKQQSAVRQLKQDGVTGEELSIAVETLLTLRGQVSAAEKKLDVYSDFNRRGFEELLLRKMFVVPSFEIHNGPAGLFDYGPPACTLKANLLSSWRQHFVVEESMLEMECTNLTPSSVLTTSGHVERFTDFMTRDTVTGECFRADKLLEDAIDALIGSSGGGMSEEEINAHRVVQRQADAYSADELKQLFDKYAIKSPSNAANELSTPFPFNLMFKTSIGPEGTSVGYLRPETAQGLFVNFRRLLDFNQQRMPFAAAQIGLGFRNEIAPRNGLIRVREFCIAEIEHFVNPKKKEHPKFPSVADVELVLFPREAQLTTGRTLTISAGQAVKEKIIASETLAYFMTRSQIWLHKIGIDPKRMRFRQHLTTEMAHYACDCWDIEINTVFGWIECVGHADRSCYDLEVHSKACNIPLVASERLPEPVLVEKLLVEPQRKKIGPKFKSNQKEVISALENLDEEEVKKLQEDLKSGSATVSCQGFEITPDMVNIKMEKKNVHEVKYSPSVIEPSFGIGRIIYALLEHSFTQRDGDEQRCVMRISPFVAATKVGLFRLTNNNPQFDQVVERIRKELHSNEITYKVDSTSGTIGRRYARADEIGIPFGITIDFDTLLDDTVTLRDRDSMAQIRIPVEDIVTVLRKLTAASPLSWEQLVRKYPVFLFDGGDDDDKSTQNKETAPSVLTLEKTSRATFSRPNDL